MMGKMTKVIFTVSGAELTMCYEIISNREISVISEPILLFFYNNDILDKIMISGAILKIG